MVNEFRLKAVPEAANTVGIYEDPSYKNLWNGKAPYFFLVLEVEVISLEGFADGYGKIDFITLDLSSDGISTDVFCEELNKEEYINKNFVVMGLNPARVEYRMINWNLLNPRFNLFIPRDAYHNVIVETEDGILPAEIPGMTDWVPPTNEQVDKASIEEFNKMVARYNDEIKNNYIFRLYKYYDTQINSTKIYWEICHDENYNEYHNSVGKYDPDTGELAGQGKSADAKHVDAKAIPTKDDKSDENSRKGWFKEYCLKKFVASREAKRIEVEKLKKWVVDWRKAGNLSDLEHNESTEKWDETAFGNETFVTYKKLVDKIKTDPQYQKYETELNNKIADASSGVRADEDLKELGNGLEKITKDEIDKGGQVIDTYSSDVIRRNKKEAGKVARARRDKILARQKEIINWIESLGVDGGKDKYVCAYCQNNFDIKTNPPIIQNGNNYCTQDHANLAKGNNDITQLRIQAITAIKNKLAEDPPVKNSELSSYSDWESRINKLNDGTEIDNLKNQVIAEIEKVRTESGNKNEVARLLTQAQGIIDDYDGLAAVLKELNKLFQTTAYRAKQTEIEAEETKLLGLDPDGSKFKQTALDWIQERLSDTGLSEQSLSAPIQTKLTDLKEDRVQKAEMLGVKNEIIIAIGKTHADNELNKLKQLVDQALKSGKATQIESAKQRVNKFIQSNNAFFLERSSDAQSLLGRLASPNQHNNGNPSNSGGFPWKIIVPVTLVVALVIGVAIYLVWRKKPAEEEE